MPLLDTYQNLSLARRVERLRFRRMGLRDAPRGCTVFGDSPRRNRKRSALRAERHALRYRVRDTREFLRLIGVTP